MDATQLILKGLGKRKVKSILNQWIKDQINRALEYGYPFEFDSYIHLEKYGVNGFEEDGVEADELFKFIGNKI
tara:strand:+ start:273 stop:491 length:219 start_codon:yes stop_codon:yes gene_type:complete